ncbi:MAG: hypothetical protein ACO1OB_30180 [Archangium sp.]
MKRALLLAGLLLSACPPERFQNEIAVEVNDGGFVPWNAARTVAVTVKGRIDSALPGASVPIRVGLTSQTGDGATKIISIIPDADGMFSEKVELTASESGSATAFAELVAMSKTSAPFIIPTGRLTVTWLEDVGGNQLSACVDIEGKAATLQRTVNGAPMQLEQVSRSCDGAPDKSSATFLLSTSDDRVVSEASNSVAPVTLEKTTATRTVFLLKPVGAPNVEGPLTDAGVPMLVSFRIETDEAVPLAAWRATVTPQGEDGFREFSGTADGQGEASLLLLAPDADQLLVRINSGRAERVLQFKR